MDIEGRKHTSAGISFTRFCSQEEMAIASVTGVPANMPGVEKKLLGPRRTGEGVDIPCAFMGRRGDGISRRGVPIAGGRDLLSAHKHVQLRRRCGRRIAVMSTAVHKALWPLEHPRDAQAA